MASGKIMHSVSPAVAARAGSDYGSDIDDDAWDTVFSQAESQPLNESINALVEDPVVPDDAPESQPRSLRLTRVRESLEKAITGLTNTSLNLAASRTGPAVQIAYDDDTNSAAYTAVRPKDEQVTPERPVSEKPERADGRSPLERFRSAPKKTMSVTDIVSPAWCELQYWYSLTMYGRIRRTPAMKAGTRIHKQKEAEVHTEVPIEIVTPEDRLGLRLWNIIQGLRTLRFGGLTREFEVFGLVEGEVMIGVIDELTYTCPDEALAAAVVQPGEGDTKRHGKKVKSKALPADQLTVDQCFTASQGNPVDGAPYFGALHDQRKVLYLVDTKTRKSRTSPPDGQMRPTQMQLMMYHRLLSELASNKVEADQIFDRYNVNKYKTFSDTFIANLGNISFSASHPRESNDEGYTFGKEITSSSEDSLDEILSHNTLSSLWAYMIAELTRTVWIDAVSSSISPVLTAEFRTSDTGELIGKRCFALDTPRLNAYVQSEMKWWRGEREAKGVEVEEAYKCRMCEFAVGCTWRTGKIQEALTQSRVKNAKGSSQAKSQV